MEKLAIGLHSIKGLNISMEGTTLIGKRGKGSYSETRIYITPQRTGRWKQFVSRLTNKPPISPQEAMNQAQELIRKAFSHNAEQVQFHGEDGNLSSIVLSTETKISPSGVLVAKARQQKQIDDIKNLASELQNLGHKKERMGNFATVR